MKIYMQKYTELGNLTGRYQDGVFQKNLESNAFFKKIMTIIELQILPKEMKDLIVDFTPIDLISTAICKLIFESYDNNIVYHLYNSQTLTIEQLTILLKKIGFNINILNNSDILKLPLSKQKQINELMLEIYPTINKANIVVENSTTDKILKKIKFEWKPVDKQYLLKIINYVREVIDSNYEDNI